MKMSEILEAAPSNARITRVQGNKVTVDQGDGVETTIDTDKNPNAVDQDERGQVTVNPDPANSAMKKKQQTRIRPGQKVSMKNENQ
jgi:hypothetical protein